jgi:hypothetical protein
VLATGTPAEAYNRGRIASTRLTFHASITVKNFDTPAQVAVEIVRRDVDLVRLGKRSDLHRLPHAVPHESMIATSIACSHRNREALRRAEDYFISAPHSEHCTSGRTPLENSPTVLPQLSQNLTFHKFTKVITRMANTNISPTRRSGLSIQIDNPRKVPDEPTTKMGHNRRLRTEFLSMAK